LQSERLQALLTYLVLRRDQSLSRQQLAVTFWPDTTDAQARTNLRTLIARLREALPDVDQCLAVDAQSVQWRSDAPCAIDVITFPDIGGFASSRCRLYRGELLPGTTTIDRGSASD
jgi:DNA-binding SARP family transcriptional activator